MSRPNCDKNEEIGRIRRLSGALIDQIAAGEVVERPASVVKELVENALDAESSRIRVEIRNGGRDWIAVTDNGWGMSPADAKLCVQRHATSKIASADDLSRIGTYGFRGEALPAIASVSQFRLRSRPKEASEAFELQIDVGETTSERMIGGPHGTRIEVSDLFRGVPARRKFLKTATTEWGHISDWLARAALSLPSVHFDVQRDDRPAVTWPAVSNPLDRVASVISEADASAFAEVSLEEGSLSVEGFVSRPERHRSTAAGIYLYVNRRPVRDRVLQHALVEIYRDLLPRGRFPAAVLFLTIPFEMVDVNVHPAKWEVRFAEPQAVHALIRHAVRNTLVSRSWLAVDTRAPLAGAPGGARNWTPSTSQSTGSDSGARSSNARSADPQSTSDWVFSANADSASASSDPAAADAVHRQNNLEGRVRFADLRLLGQFLSTYLVLETKEQLLLIDQHAAHERVLFERLRAEWLERGIESQGLLVPITLRLDPRPLAALIECKEATQRLGFDWEPFDDETVAVRAVPALLGDREPGQLIRNLADELDAAGDCADALRAGSRSLEAADQIFASLACHSARRRGDVLGDEEQRALLDALDAIPWAPCCPHGRPVAVPIELAEIERRFSRR